MGAFDVFASGYLLKPVEPQKFTECMDRIVSQLRPKKEDIYTFKGRNGIVSIELEQLIAVENVARVMHFYMEQGKVYESVYIRKPFEQELDRLLRDLSLIHILIVEDIIDSGRTLSYLIEVLKQRGPESIRLCTLLDKPERRVKKQVTVDYTCFTIPDEFVVGYGLDYAQKYRNLPYIGVVEQ